MVPWLAEGWQGILIADTCPIKLFSLNDYLGLSTHPKVCAAAAAAASAGGMGTNNLIQIDTGELFTFSNSRQGL